MHAEKCPVCNGSGKYDGPNADNFLSSRALATLQMDCHGCGGKGWVEVQNSLPDDLLFLQTEGLRKENGAYLE